MRKKQILQREKDSKYFSTNKRMSFLTAKARSFEMLSTGHPMSKAQRKKRKLMIPQIPIPAGRNARQPSYKSQCFFSGGNNATASH